MAIEPALMPAAGVDSSIHVIRGLRVMLDSDLAAIYGVPLKRLNEQVRRNRSRFPGDFCFQLTKEEYAGLKSQFATSSGHGGKRKLPWAFTEHGALMAAGVLSSERAVEMSIFVVRAFVQMRETLLQNRQLAAKLDELERRIGGHDALLADLINSIRPLLEPPVETKPRREIGFHIRDEARAKPPVAKSKS